jgi:FMN phosphatase YigB (HAD superfamily)
MKKKAKPKKRKALKRGILPEVIRARQGPLKKLLREKKLEAILSDGGNILFNDRSESEAIYKFCREYDIVSSPREYDTAFEQRFGMKYRTFEAYTKEDAVTDFLEYMERQDLVGEAVGRLAEVKAQKKSQTLFPGVKDALETIHSAGIPYIIMTDAGKPGAKLTKFLDRWEIGDVVTDIISSVDVGTVKPDPQFFDYVLTKHNIDPERFVFIAHAADELQVYELGYAVLACNPDRNVKGKGFVEVATFADVPKALGIRRKAS